MTPSCRIEARELGVRYRAGATRDDLQSLAYRAIGRSVSPRRHHWALRDVSFTVQAGEILGVVGANGAGKSTLCRTLAGVIGADEGSLAIQGRSSALLALGTDFRDDQTGRENVMLSALMLGLSRREAAALMPSVLELTGLGRFIDEPLRHYSAGMRVRLGFAIGAAVDPEILILDETLASGDAAFSARASRVIDALIARARLAVIVTHHVDFVARHCSRALWLHAGGLREQGAPGAVVEAYRSWANAAGRAAVVPAPAPAAARQPRGPRGSREVIAARNLRVTYRLSSSPRNAPKTINALDGVDLRVTEGEIVGIIGANGAGKTTLSRTLTGIIRPDAGQLDVRGRASALLTLGAGFNDQLPGADNIFLNGLMLGMRREQIRTLFDEIVDFAGLADVIGEPVKHYSMGMRARLAFSIAVAMDPDLLILDEALNAGDAAFHERASRRLHSLIDRARAVIVVSHNLPLIESVCTRGLWLHRGKVVFDGSTTEAVARYRASVVPTTP